MQKASTKKIKSISAFQPEKNSSETIRNAKVFFEYGVEYTICSTFTTPDETFETGQKFIYLNETFNRVNGCTLYSFYDLSNGKVRIWNLDSAEPEVQLKAISEKFKISGGWPKPNPGSSVQPAGNVNTTTLPAVLRQFIPYFKSIVEGDPETENWFVFFDRNNYIFENSVPAKEYLRWKNYPYSEIEAFLLKEHIVFTPQIRYQWLKQ